MQRHRDNGLEWLTFDLLSDIPGLIHGVITSKNGFCNLNFDIVKKTFDIPLLVASDQVHDNKIALIEPSSDSYLVGYDGLITRHSAIGLLTSHGDCQAALFYDPIQKVIANVHSGWRGSVKNIYKTAINHLKIHFSCKPENLLVCIGPSLGPHNAEFTSYKQELPPTFWPFQVKENHFDFWSISEMQLAEAGVLPQHIEIARICTLDNADDFYSYRRQKRNGIIGPLQAANATLITLV